jgi:rare lipoprotein A
MSNQRLAAGILWTAVPRINAFLADVEQMCLRPEFGAGDGHDLASVFHVRLAMWSGRRCRSCVLRLLAATIGVLLALCGTVESSTPAPVQVGLASWYGPGFHGQETASGEIFDQREMVAAHRTLPLGSVIRVTNLENGRRVTLRVIDRGPYGRNFRKGTVVDVSRGAARRLGMIKDGLVKVRIEVRRLGRR